MIRRLREVDASAPIGHHARHVGLRQRPLDVAGEQIDAEGATRRFAHVCSACRRRGLAVIRVSYARSCRAIYTRRSRRTCPPCLEAILAPPATSSLRRVETGDIPHGNSFSSPRSSARGSAPCRGRSMQLLSSALFQSLHPPLANLTAPRTWEDALPLVARLDASRKPLRLATSSPDARLPLPRRLACSRGLPCCGPSCTRSCRSPGAGIAFTRP